MASMLFGDSVEENSTFVTSVKAADFSRPAGVILSGLRDANSGAPAERNAAATSVFGYEPGEALGQPVHMLCPEGAREAFDKLYASVRAGSVVHADVVRRHKDGRLIDVSANIAGIRSSDGAAARDYAHHVVWVFVKQDVKWMAAAARPYRFGDKLGQKK